MNESPFQLCSNIKLSSYEALLVVWLKSGPDFSNDFYRLKRFLYYRVDKYHWKIMLQPFQGDTSNGESYGCNVFLFVPPDPDAPEGYPIRDAILQMMDHFNVFVEKIGGSEISETEI